MFQRIVVGCDGSAEGRDAAALGAGLASAAGAGLSLVCAYPTAFFPIPGVSDRGTLRDQAEATLRRERDSLAPQGLIHDVADPSVARALRHYAARWHAGLVVVGSNPSVPVGHVAIGRRGRQLLYEAPFALALARRGLHERGVELQRIGVGYDGGREAQAALTFAAELGRAAGSRLAVHSVVEDTVPSFTAEEWMALKDWDHHHVLEGARKSAQAEAQEAVSLLGTLAEVTAAVGDPGLQLRAFSEDVDLLVVGSRRWGPLARLVAGSVGETLVTEASCSVVIVPRPAKAPEDARRRPRGVQRVSDES